MSLEMSKKNMSNKVPTGSHSRQWAEVISLVKSLAIFFGIAFMLRASVVEAFKIPSSSMEPTLQIGDHILVNKLSYGIRLPLKTETLFDFRGPKRGDVVVFTLPEDASINIIKRVIGLPGDVVEVRGTRVYINGKMLKDDEHYAKWIKGGIHDFGPERVPDDSVLLLGDNRDQSRDSRLWETAFLDVSRIKGRAFLIYWNLASLRRMFNIIE